MKESSLKILESQMRFLYCRTRVRQIKKTISGFVANHFCVVHTSIEVMIYNIQIVRNILCYM